MELKKKYTVVPANDDSGYFFISSSDQAFGNSPICIEDIKEPIRFELLEEATFFCETLSTKRYDHLLVDNALKFHDAERLPIIQIKLEQEAIHELGIDKISIPRGFVIFPKHGDLLLSLRLSQMQSFVDGEDIPTLNEDDFLDLTASKKLSSDKLSLQGLTFDEWSASMSDFNECEEWICGLFGFHSILEIITCLESQTKLFQNFMFGNWGNNKNVIKNLKKISNKEYPNWIRTEIGGRWHEFTKLIPEQMLWGVGALNPISNSSILSLFCLVTKQSPDAFAKYATRLADLSADEENLSYTDAFQAYKDVKDYLNIWEKQNPESFIISPKRYLNCGDQPDFWIDPNDLKVGTDESRNIVIAHFANDKSTVIENANGQKDAFVFKNESLAKEIIQDLKRFKKLILETDGSLHQDSRLSFYALESFCQNPKVLQPNIRFLPTLTADDPEHFWCRLMASSATSKGTIDFDNGEIGEYLRFHKDDQEQIKTAFLSDQKDAEYHKNAELGIFLLNLRNRDFGEWVLPFAEWRLGNNLSESGFWGFNGILLSSQLSGPTNSLLLGIWQTELDDSKAIEEIKRTEPGRRWFEFTRDLYVPIYAGSFALALRTGLSPEFFLFCLMEEKPPSFVRSYFETIEKHTYLELPTEFDVKKLVEAYEICSDFVRLKTKIDTSEDIAHRLIQKEESIVLEYKASFQTPVPEIASEINEKGQTIFKLGKLEFSSLKNVQKHLQLQSLKAVAGFLNTQGGTLIIGVHEIGGKNSIIGIESEFAYENDDQYERHFMQQIINHFGKPIAGDYVNTQIHTINSKKIMEVKIRSRKTLQGAEPVFLNDKLYKRTGPRTDELLGPEIMKFTLEFQKPILEKIDNFVSIEGTAKVEQDV